MDAFLELIDSLRNSRPGGRLPWSRNVTNSGVPFDRAAADGAVKRASVLLCALWGRTLRSSHGRAKARCRLKPALQAK